MKITKTKLRQIIKEQIELLERKVKNFKDLGIGDKFHIGKSKGGGVQSNIEKWTEFKKIDKSTAEVIDQIGYGNKRLVGSTKKFSPNSMVVLLDK